MTIPHRVWSTLAAVALAYLLGMAMTLLAYAGPDEFPLSGSQYLDMPFYLAAEYPLWAAGILALCVVLVNVCWTVALRRSRLK